MRTSPATVHVNKLAAASRQLDAAIRIFFAREDEFAVHTVAAAAFRILRDLLGKRGKKVSSEIIQAGIYNIARQYAEGKIPNAVLTHIQNTELMEVIKQIVDDVRLEGDQFDRTRIQIVSEARDEQRMWPSKAANFLKHADRDAEEHLAVDEIKNENVLIGACVAYLEIMRVPTREIIAFCAFWAVKNDSDVDLWHDEVQQLFAKLKSVGEPTRYRLCRKYIRDDTKE